MNHGRATVYLGGTIRTMDASNPTVNAVVTVGDRILYAGGESEARRMAGPESTAHDLVGACLLPGFVDAHTHPLMLGQCTSWADLTGIGDAATLIARLRDHAATLPANVPIRGFGYDQHLFPDGRHPTASQIDSVVDGRAVVIMHASGHGYVANHAALREAGITSDTSTPPGGLIGRDENGHLDGRIFDAACDLLTGTGGVKIGNHGPNFHLSDDPDVLLDHLLSAQQMLFAAGITSVGDAQVTDREMQVYLHARARGVWQLRVSMMLLSSHLPYLESLGLTAGFGDDTLRICGVKFYADGSLISGTAYLPCGCGGEHGHLYHSFEELAALIEQAHRLGFQTMTHAQGETPIGVVLDAIDDAQRRSPRADARHRIEHCGLPSDDQIARMRLLDVWPIPQPTQVWQYGAGIRRERGEVAERMYPSGLYERAGVPVVLSSDVPVTMPDVMRSMWAAATRSTLGGDVLGPDCTISMATALAGYTIRAAESLHRESVVGSLTAGKLADLVVVDRDPLTVPVAKVPGLRVVRTIVGGSTVWAADSR